MKRRILVFEQSPGPLNYALLAYYMARGFEIYYIFPEKSYTERRFVKALKDAGLMKKVEREFRLSMFDSIYPDKAFDNVERVYGTISSDGLVKRAAELYGDERIGLVFKKELTRFLSRFYYINTVLHELEKAFPGADILFAPAKVIYMCATDDNEAFTYRRYLGLVKKAGASYLEAGRTGFPPALILLSAMRYYIQRALIWLKAAAVYAWMAARMLPLRQGRREASKRRYAYGVMIINQQRQFGSSAGSEVDWLLDARRITKDNTVFISNSRLSGRNRDHMNSKALAFVDEPLKLITAGEAGPSLRYLAYLLGDFADKENSVLNAYLNAVFLFVKWKAFARVFCLDNLVSHADFGIQSVARNIILKKEFPRTRTWYYMDSVNFHCYHTNDESLAFRYAGFGFIFYDHLLAWNDKMASFFRDHHGLIGEARSIGCPWAERIWAPGASGRISAELERSGYREGDKVVSFFDTTLFDNSLTKYSDGIEFLRHIIRLAGDMEDLYIILKMKYPAERMKTLCPPMWELYGRMKGCKNIYIASPAFSSSEIISVSDLTVSYAFTSTTIEAIASGRKGFYHDPASRFRGTYFDRVPHLVTHGYDELLAGVKRSLLEMGDGAYREYVDRFVKEHMDPFADGRALERFRTMIAREESPAVMGTGKDAKI